VPRRSQNSPSNRKVGEGGIRVGGQEKSQKQKKEEGGGKEICGGGLISADEKSRHAFLFECLEEPWGKNGIRKEDKRGGEGGSSSWGPQRNKSIRSNVATLPSDKPVGMGQTGKGVKGKGKEKVQTTSGGEDPCLKSLRVRVLSKE